MFRSIVIISAVLALPGIVQAVDLGTYKGTNLQLGGYIKAEGVFKHPEEGDNRFDASMKQSRLNLRTAREMEGHQLSSFLEVDFYGSNGSNTTEELRLRHAMIQVDNTQIGQYWSAQVLSFMSADLLDFVEPARGTIAKEEVRPVLIHQTINDFRLSVQDPIYEDADMPDFAVTYSKTFENDNAFNVLTSVREVENDEVAAGIAMSGAIHLTRDDEIRVNTHYGDGWAKFTRIGEDVSPSGEKITQYGANISYQHWFNDRNRSNIQYTHTRVDDQDDTRYSSVHVNFIHTWFRDLDVGIEWRRFDLSPVDSINAQQVEVMAMYRF